MKFQTFPLVLSLALVISCNSQPNQPTQKTFVEHHPDTLQAPPTSAKAANPNTEQGAYLVSLLGCGTCHTDGALVGTANAKYMLAGSRIGIATNNPLIEAKPGIVFPPNLTPDPNTGLGQWSETDIVLMLKAGEDRHGIGQSPVMPWASYAQLSDEDALAIAQYLKSLAPIAHKVPATVRKGQSSNEAHVYFGVYQKP